MRWRGRRQSSNIQDMRGRSRNAGYRPRGGGRVVRAGSGGLSGILVLIVLFVVLRACGIDPMVLFDETGMGQTTQQSPNVPAGTTRNDETTQFVATVLAETEDVWQGVFQSEGQNYPEPTLVLFDDSVGSACGFASAATGPFYCPGDRKVYIDLSFYDELAGRFGASGDFAQAYVLAHEVGHHVQNVLGVLPEFDRQRQQMSEADANALSVRVELQADCFAGIWGHFTEQKGILEAGDLEEALNAATQIGDDAIQRRTQGYVVPESFNHGTSAQRRAWFNKGFESGKIDDCDTFNNPV